MKVGQEYTKNIVLLFQITMASVIVMVPLTTNIEQVYENAQQHDQNFIQNIALFLTAFLSCHLVTLEQHGNI